MHDHGSHDAHHGHSHENAFRYGIILNILLVAAQSWASMRSGSVSLMADAWHNLGDVLGLILAWAATHLAMRPTSERFTYGLKSSTIWAALLNSGILLFLTGALVWESILRFQNPQTIDTSIVIPFAALGILINAGSAIPFFKSKDLNHRGAFMHLAADALVSVGVLVAAFIQGRTHLNWIDPVASVLICVVIAAGSISMDGVPKRLNVTEISEKMLAHPGVEKIHDLHVWALGTSDCAMTCHLLPRSDTSRSELLRSIEEMLEAEFDIDHVTIQLEDSDSFIQCQQAKHTEFS
jgi:cobalt-zinc-cadmium efflux system protein